MSLLMLLAAGRWKKPKVTFTKTFTANGTFLVPVGVSFVDLDGNGGAGIAAHTSTTAKTTTTTDTLYRRTGGTDVVITNSSGWIGPGSTTGVNQCAPSRSFCNPDTDPTCSVGSTVYSSGTKCYSYAGGSRYTVPATTGASATAFGKVFPGGLGGPATTTTFKNVPATAGASYAIVVPAGGSVTITYSV